MIKNIVEHAVIPSNLVGTAIEYKDKLFMFTRTFGYDPDYLIKTRKHLITFSNKHLNYLKGIEKNADDAKTVADDAKTVADDAKTAADDAKTAADDAKTVADDAKTAADDAKTAADDAKTAADDAKTAADDAERLVATLRVKNGEGVGSIVLAVESDGDDKHPRATGDYAIAIGRYGKATGRYALGAGYETEAAGKYSIAFGNGNTASGDNAIAAGGTSNTASGVGARAYGDKSVSSGDYATASGKRCKASGKYSKAYGFDVEASGEGAVAEGNHCIATGDYSKAEGAYNEAIGYGSKAYGYKSKALGRYSVAGGYASESGKEGLFSYTFAHGYGVKAPHKTAAFGIYNNPIADRLVTVGNGSSDENRSNAFSVQKNGNCIAARSFINNSADYAEYFEWEDGNPNNEDRVGYFVTLTKNGKIRKANEYDDILGVVSATPSVIGNAFEDEWQGKYLTDEWGRIRYQTVTYPAEYNEVGEQVSDERVVEEPILNPEYDPTKEYIPRSKRKEWSVVGLLGQLKVRVDGLVDKRIKCGTNGRGVYSANGYIVIRKVSDSIAEIFLR